MKYDFLLVRGIFRKFPVQAKLAFSPLACPVHVRGGRESFLFSMAAMSWLCLDGIKSCSEHTWKVFFLQSYIINEFKIAHVEKGGCRLAFFGVVDGQKKGSAQFPFLSTLLMAALLYNN